jgi:hypothetical protein
MKMERSLYGGRMYMGAGWENEDLRMCGLCSSLCGEKNHMQRQN